LTTDSKDSHTLTGISDPAEDASGVFGGAVALDGNDAFSIDDHADFKPSGDFTVGFWMKTTESVNTNTYIFQSYSQNTAVAGIHIFMNLTGGVGRLAFVSGKNTGTSTPTHFAQATGDTTTPLNDGSWHFCVCVWDGSYLRIYVDGLPSGSAVAWANAPAYAATNYVRIGCLTRTGTDQYHFNGSLDDVFFINGAALSSSDVLGLYYAGASESRSQSLSASRSPSISASQSPSASESATSSFSPSASESWSPSSSVSRSPSSSLSPSPSPQVYADKYSSSNSTYTDKYAYSNSTYTDKYRKW
jgi:hypothetical protein